VDWLAVEPARSNNTSYFQVVAFGDSSHLVDLVYQVSIWAAHCACVTAHPYIDSFRIGAIPAREMLESPHPMLGMTRESVTSARVS
jgi:hypothetical protein